MDGSTIVKQADRIGISIDRRRRRVERRGHRVLQGQLIVEFKRIERKKKKTKTPIKQHFFFPCTRS